MTCPMPQNHYSPHPIFKSSFLTQFLIESLENLYMLLNMHVLNAVTVLQPNSIFLIF